MSKQHWVLFDFDHTLTSCHSVIPFIQTSFPFQRRLLFWSFKLPLWALSYPATKQSFKSLWVRHFLTNLKEDSFKKICNEFGQTILPSLIKPNALELLKKHQKEGFNVAIISASLQQYLAPLQNFLNLGAVIGTQIEINEGVLTGNIQGANCKKAEKLHRFYSLFPKKENEITHAYGDSDGDKEMLEAALYPHYRQI